ncbi:hypothetical protein [Aquisphaera insulae]|uniref:hypothetical protein n=1 Tax=Aquisphaera insulae TaxID=2712864 RepID=UPI0013EB8816|nr:hypothetical protein [Aquisphaera insulae]
MSKKPPPGMIGPPPSARGGRPADPGLHAQQIAREWEDVGESYIRRRMQQVGIPEDQIGQPTFSGDGKWRAFDPNGRAGGANTTGVVVDSGVLNPDLLKGFKGGRLWRKMRIKDRIDSAISHEYEELLAGGNHAEAIREAARSRLPISEEARRLNRARAR